MPTRPGTQPCPKAQPQWHGRATELWFEARPPVQLVFVLRAVAGAGLESLGSPQGVLLAIGWLMLSTAVYLFNGLSDLEGDRLNGSTRPLATGRLPEREAWLAVLTLAVGGIAICAVISLAVLYLAVAFLALGWAYSAGPAFKKTTIPASVTIGLGAGLTYAAGFTLRGSAALSEILLPSLLVAWVAAASNSKDLSDVSGDRAAGRRTLAVTYGLLRASLLIATSTLITAAGALILIMRFQPAMLATGITLAIGSLVFSAMIVRGAGGADATTRRHGYRAYMACQYALNAVLLFAGYV